MNNKIALLLIFTGLKIFSSDSSEETFFKYLKTVDGRAIIREKLIPKSYDLSGSETSSSDTAKEEKEEKERKEQLKLWRKRWKEKHFKKTAPKDIKNNEVIEVKKPEVSDQDQINNLKLLMDSLKRENEAFSKYTEYLEEKIKDIILFYDLKLDNMMGIFTKIFENSTEKEKLYEVFIILLQKYYLNQIAEKDL